MVLPVSLLAGLLVVAVNCELLPSLPGAASLATLLPSLLLLALPSLLARVALHRARTAPGLSAARVLLRLSALATPLGVHAFWLATSYGDWLDEWAWDTHLGRMVLAMLPVYLAEVPRIGASTLAASTIEVRTEVGAALPAGATGLTVLPQWMDVAEFARMRLGGPLLVAMPLLLLGGMLDLLQLHRPTYSFVVCTAPGVVLGAFAFLLTAVAALPFWFRVAFAVRPLPEPIGTRLRATAAALGFAPHRLWLMPTGMRALNAMLVGPLPLGRCLCLTDGLLRELDGDALAGVVAHEVGHAKRNHPAILIALVVVVPLAALVPVRAIDFDAWDELVRAAVVLGTAFAAWLVVRTLAHRFEHEADATSVAALGAAPCSRALLVVSRLAWPVEHGWLTRLFTLHPEEPRRWRLMQRYEQDPAFRATFERRSRLLRTIVLAVVVVSLGLGAVGSRIDWPFEYVVWRLHAGDRTGALRAMAELDHDVPERWQRTWRFVREDLAAVAATAPSADSIGEIDAELLAKAWRQGEATLLSSGPAAARPFFAVALAGEPRPTALQRALHGYCDAAADEDTARMAAIAAVVRARGVPPALQPVFAP